MSVSVMSASAYDIIHRKPYYRTQNYYYNRVLPNDLSALEKYSMRHSFSGEKPEKRLERLETLAFGAAQAGNIETRYRNVEAAILSRPRYDGAKNTFISNLNNFINGRPTGYTPPVTQYPNQYFMPSLPVQSGYNNQRYQQFSNGIFGSGYNFLNSGFGNGSSVRILD